MLLKNQEDKINLMEKKERLMEGDEDDDLMGEDLEMIKANM